MIWLAITLWTLVVSTGVVLSLKRVTRRLHMINSEFAPEDAEEVDR